MNVYPINDFINFIKDGYITDYDGVGYFGNGTECLGIMQIVDIPYIRKMQRKNKNYTHIHWLNR